MQKATIKGGESLSSAISLWGTKFFALDIPDSFTGTTITFQGGSTDFAMKNIYSSDGTEVQATVAPGTMCSLDGIALALAPYRCMKIRSGTSDTPVVQLGDTAASGTVDFGDDKVLTLTSGAKGTRANGLVFSFEINTEDTLSVTAEGRVVTIRLADTTASSNTAAAIQAAIRTLATVNDVDVTGFTVAASAEYTAAPPTGGKASAVVTVSTGKTLTFTYPSGGTDGNGLEINIQTNSEDTLSVTNPPSTNEISIRMASTTRTKNEDTDIQTAVRALGTIGDYDVSQMTVVGNAAYDAAPPAGVAAVLSTTLKTDQDVSLGMLTATAGVVGPIGNAVLSGIFSNIAANVDDTLSVTCDVTSGYPVMTTLLANTTPANNAVANILAAMKAHVPTGTLYDAYITGMTLEGDSTWVASPPITTPHSLDTTAGTNVAGAYAIDGVLEATLAGGTDVADAQVIIDGGDDPTIGVIMKE